MMLYRFEVTSAVDTATAARIFEGLKEDYGYDKALGKLYSASGICKCIAEFNEPVAQMSKA